MARTKRAWFASLGVALLLLQAAVVPAAAVFCSKHCAAALSAQSCCEKKSKATEKKSCRDECAKSFDSVATWHGQVSLHVAEFYEVPAVFELPEIVESPVSTLAAVLFSSDSSPPTRGPDSTVGLRAPPTYGA